MDENRSNSRYITSPLNPIWGVILRVWALSSCPRSLYAAWKMMLPELPLSTSILFTMQFAIVSEITRASWCGVRTFSCSLAVKLISSDPRSRHFGLAASRPCLAFQWLFFAAAWLCRWFPNRPQWHGSLSPVAVARWEQLQWAYPLSSCLDGSSTSRKGTPWGVPS